MKSDAIAIVEAAYDCEGDVRCWLDALVERAGPRLDRGFGIGVAMYEPGVDPGRTPTILGSMTKEVHAALTQMCIENPNAFHRVNTTPDPMGTVGKALGMSLDEIRAWPPFVQHLHPLGIKEVTGVVARDPSGTAIILTAPMPDVRRPARREVSSWSRLAAHISAGARLRRAFPGVGPGRDPSEGAEAVLSPSGSIQHAEAFAQSPSARESLRRAAKAIDRARSKARSSEDEALELWQGLVAGRWSLVDRFDTDGRRFLVARKNDPEVTDPRALTLRERQVLAYVAMGHPPKLIAYALGISASSVSGSRRTAMRKLGLCSYADVVMLFAPAAPPPLPEGRPKILPGR